MTYILLLIIILALIIFYLAALLVFIPYEEDDKYIFKILELGYRLHSKAIRKNRIFKFLIDFIAKIILLLSYFILKDRKYTKIINNDDSKKFK